jgi:hypothetical protein
MKKLIFKKATGKKKAIEWDYKKVKFVKPTKKSFDGPKLNRLIQDEMGLI